MGSTNTRHIAVKAPQREVVAAVRDWWDGLGYDDKQVKLDILPGRFWGTFLHRSEDNGDSRKQTVHINISIKDGAGGDFAFGGGYGRLYLNISCLIPDPILGDNANEYCREFMEWLKFRFEELGVHVEEMGE